MNTGRDFHIPAGPEPWPAHESLQEYAKRTGLPNGKAYARWHGRIYAEATIVHGHPDPKPMRLREHGPGLGLTNEDIRRLL